MAENATENEGITVGEKNKISAHLPIPRDDMEEGMVGLG